MTIRQLNILKAVIEEYIKNGEPVGSKLLENKLDFVVSSATIRNEMAALEKEGYLEHPHTSAGRVPTYKGFRLYIEQIMQPKPLSDDEKSMIDAMLGDMGSEAPDVVLQTAAGALSELTKCAVVVSDHSPQFSVITDVEVIPTGKRMYVMLLIASNGSVKNRACRLEFDLTNEQIDFFKGFVKSHLRGVALDALSEELFEELSLTLGGYMLSLSPLLYTVYEMSSDMMKTDIEMAGESNLLKISDVKTEEVINFLDNRKELAQLLDESFSGIHILFGQENDKFVVTNSSIIASNFKRSDKNAGYLGIIGPMRIDYSTVIPYIEYFTEKISGLLSDDEYDEGDNENGK